MTEPKPVPVPTIREQGRIAFVLETIANLSTSPGIQPHVKDLRVAAMIVRMADDCCLKAAKIAVNGGRQ